MARSDRFAALLVLVPLLLLPACGGTETDFATLASQRVSKVRTDRTYFRDAQGRYVFFHGVNLGGDTKVPCRYIDAQGQAHDCWAPGEGRSVVNPEFRTANLHTQLVMAPDVSYVGRPFPQADADHWFGLLERLGFNSVRFIFNWDSLEHAGPGQYDTAFLDQLEALVDAAARHGIYCLMDMHQDTFLRYLHVKFNNNPEFGQPGSIEWMLYSLLPHTDGKLDPLGGFDDLVAGHGAPRWVAETCLPHKNFDSPWWGYANPLGRLSLGSICSVYQAYQVISKAEEPLSDGTCQLLTVANIEQAVCAYLKDPSAPTDLPPDIPPKLDGLVALTKTTPWLGPLVEYICSPDRPQFSVNDSTDFLPWTFWGVNNALSIDMERCMAAFLAGRKVWPQWYIDPASPREKLAQAEGGVHIQDFLQQHYRDAWLKVVERVKDKPNVIGYDLMNEPPTIFLLMTVAAAIFDVGVDSIVVDVLKSLFPDNPDLATELYAVISALGLLPKDTTPETKAAWGYEGADLLAMLDLNYNTDAIHLQGLYEFVGTAIQEADPDAVIWIERGAGISMLGEAGGYGAYETYMRWPRNLASGTDDPSDPDYFLKQVVFAPHWYPDIYPFIGLNQPPRTFTPQEQHHKDYTEKLTGVRAWAEYSLGNPPTVLGEFGTYYNFGVPRPQPADAPGALEALKAEYERLSYPVSAEILDNYYEALEALMLPHMQWCFSAQNDYFYGDWWNHEDFSLIDPEGNPRAHTAFSRPYARALSGKPISSHFYSDHHYYDPSKGQVDPQHEFVVEFASKETEAPTEVFVPQVQYPAGFYVWLSDGYATFDWDRRVLYWYPTADQPGTVHRLRLLPPLPGETNPGWTYFFEDGKALDGDRAPR
jgi:aryl-phospho-beta-D-glucosidase BglC (GH1 family)